MPRRSRARGDGRVRPARRGRGDGAARRRARAGIGGGARSALRPLADRGAAIAAEAAELARDVAAAADAVELDPAARADAEERLAFLYDLRRKYGDTIEAVVEFGTATTAELERLENQEERERLRAGGRPRRPDAVAARLTAARDAAAKRLARAVNGELPPLGLPAGAFDVTLEAADVGPSGADRVTFTFAPNPGEPPRPLTGSRLVVRRAASPSR